LPRAGKLAIPTASIAVSTVDRDITRTVIVPPKRVVPAGEPDNADRPPNFKLLNRKASDPGRSQCKREVLHS